MDKDSFEIYINTEDTYADIVKDLETITQRKTRPLPRGKHK